MRLKDDRKLSAFTSVTSRVPIDDQVTDPGPGACRPGRMAAQQVDEAMVQPLPVPDSGQSFEYLVDEIQELRPLPDIAAQIIRMAEDDQFSAQELGRTVSIDQALTLTVLRLANSAFYGLPRRITTLRDAVVLLGFREVKTLAVAACLMDSAEMPEFMDYARFWLNSVTIGMLAEILAVAEGRDPKDAFTAGILHNIGRLALAQHRPVWLERTVEQAVRIGRPIHDVQRDTLGFSDAELGAAMAGGWGFPEQLVEAVAYHASELRLLPDRNGLDALVLRARRYARAHGTTDGLDEQSQLSPDLEWATPPIASVLQLRGGIDGIHQHASSFLGTVGGTLEEWPAEWDGEAPSAPASPMVGP